MNKRKQELANLSPDKAVSQLLRICLAAQPADIPVLIQAAFDVFHQGPTVLYLLDFWHRAHARTTLRPFLDAQEEAFLTRVAASPHCRVPEMPTTGNPQALILTTQTLMVRRDDRWTRLPLETLPPEHIRGAQQSLVVFGHAGQLVGTFEAHLHPPQMQGYRFDRYWVADPADYAVLTAACDLQALAASDYQVHLLHRNEAEQQLRALLDHGMQPPQQFHGFAQTGAACSALRQFCDHLAQQQQQIQADFIRQLSVVYNAGFLDALREAEGMPRVLLLTSRHTSYVQFACRDLAAGFRQLGCETLVLKERDDQGVGFTTAYLLRRIHQWQPDVLVSVNNFRMGVLHQACPGLPFVSWIQDPPFTLSPPTTMGPTDFVFAVGRGLVPDIRNWTPDLEHTPIGILPTVTTGDVYRPLPDVTPTYDVSFVGHLHLTPEIHAWFCPHHKQGTPFEQLVHQGMDAMAVMGRMRYLPMINKQATCLDWITALPAYVQHGPEAFPNADTLWRFFWLKLGVILPKISALGALIDAGITSLCIGGKGWQQLPKFAPYAVGPVANGDALNRIFNATRVNVNISPFLSFHPKFSEVVWSGGFVLSPDNGDWDLQRLDDYFQPGEEIDTFTDDADLVAKVKKHLAHPEEARRLMVAARKRLVRDFSPAATAAGMLNRVLGRQITGFKPPIMV